MGTNLASGPREECGICGIFGHPDSAKLAYFGLYALQHRGQESAGITSSDGHQVYEHKAMGLVSEVFHENDFAKLKGDMAIGHVRYSTTGASNLVNAQPFTANHRGETFAVAHNGNLVNIRHLRNELEDKGSIFQSTMDSEVVVHPLARACCRYGLSEAITATVKQLDCAYSILMMTTDKLVAIRDPQGFRPLCLGKLANGNGGGYVLASETCALDLIEAEYIRDIEPGEAVIISEDGLESFFPQGKQQSSFCIFEHVNFARPDSDIFGLNVYNYRKRTGEILAKECQIEADFVMPFPDSGNYAAIGFSQASGIPLEFGVIRNHYVGRTFIQPSQSMRDFSVRVKLNPVRSFLEGKRVIIIEDSIIRGTTGRSRVKALRKAGAKEIHMLISCPPTINPCYYGVDFPDKGQLIAAQKTIEEIRDYMDLDTLYYLSLEGLVQATNMTADKFCLACFNGKYPVEPDLGFHKEALNCGCGKKG